MSYKDLYNKMNIVHELLVNRYMLSVLLTNVFNLIEIQQNKERLLTNLLDEKDKKKFNRTPPVDDIEFNNFKISNKFYQRLIKEYGAEVVTNACVILDKYIETTGKKPKRVDMKLKDWAIKLAMQDRLSNYTSTICQAITQIDYHDIDTVENARKYIQGTPSYLRNIDEGCKYLKEKFNL